MINEFPVNMEGTTENFNEVIDSLLEQFEFDSPFIPLPEQTITLDANEDYSVVASQIISSIIDANSGGSHITFTGSLPAGEMLAVAIVGSDYTVTAGITFEMKDSPCLLICTEGGWRSLSIGSQIVDRPLADSIFTSVPTSLSDNANTAQDWVNDELTRYFKIINMGELSDYSKVLDQSSPVNPVTPSPDVTFPAPPLANGTTTVLVRPWGRGVHRVQEIPASSGPATHVINIDLSQYSQDDAESGATSTTYIHFENSELTVGIPLNFVNMPAGMSWGLDPSEVFTNSDGQSALNFHAIRIERIRNKLFLIPYTISPN